MSKTNPKTNLRQKAFVREKSSLVVVQKQAGRKGISFIEMLVAIAIFSIIIMVATSVAAIYLRNRTMITKYQEASEELSLVLNYLSKELRMSGSDSVAPLTVGQCKSVRVINNHDAANYVIYTFDPDTKNLTKSISGGVSSVVVSDVDGNFYVTDNDIKRITIVIWKTDRPDRTFQTTVSTRSGYKDD